MAAQEEDDQGVVLIGRGVPGVSRRAEQILGELANGVQAFTPASGLFAAQQIRHPAGRDGGQPARGVGRQSLVPPLGSSGQQRFLDCVLGYVEATETPGDRGEDLRRVLTQQVLDAARWHGQISWTALVHHRPQLDPVLDQGGEPGRQLDGPVVRGDVDDPEAGQHFLGLRIRPVRGDRTAVGDLDRQRVRRVGQPEPGHHLAAVLELSVELSHGLEVGFDLLLRTRWRPARRARACPRPTDRRRS